MEKEAREWAEEQLLRAQAQVRPMHTSHASPMQAALLCGA